jgi:hypothetical protein
VITSIDYIIWVHLDTWGHRLHLPAWMMGWVCNGYDKALGA